MNNCEGNCIEICNASLNFFKVLNYPVSSQQGYPAVVPNALPGPYFPHGTMNQPGGNYPQYPANIPFPSGGGGYGLVKNRQKRQLGSKTIKDKGANKSPKKVKNSNKKAKVRSDDNMHWGVHRILSTGKLRQCSS